MKILSFDIGVNNLSYCKVDENMKIINNFWNDISIIEDSSLFNLKCCGKTKKGTICGKRCCFYKENSEVKDGFCKVHKLDDCTEIKKKKVRTYTIQELNQKLIEKMDSIPEFLDCDTVLIEQQPNKNPTMKNLSFMLNSYFIIRGIIDKKCIKKVIFISAKNKLKDVKDKKIKKTYAERKKLSIETCRKKIEESQKDLLEFFNNHYKKDDLADCYNQADYYINKFVKK